MSAWAMSGLAFAPVTRNRMISFSVCFKSRIRFLLPATLLIPLLFACTPAEGDDQSSATATTLTVYAAASLTNAFGEIAERYEANHPGVTLTFNFAGSNQLATQISAGAPVDVFASANPEQMAAVVAAGHIDDDAPAVFATNRLVVIYPADNPGNLTSLQDLSKPDILLVLAAEEVPVGGYSLDFLAAASADPAFGESFQSDVLANVVSYEENVRAVLNKVSLGEADAGIVYASDLVGTDGVSQIDIPDALNSIARYPIAVLNDSSHQAAARSFVDFVLSADGQQILAGYGFGVGEPR